MMVNVCRARFVNGWGEDAKVELQWLYSNWTKYGDAVGGLAGESTPK